MRRLMILAVMMGGAAMAVPPTLGTFKDAAGQAQQTQGVTLQNADGSIAMLPSSVSPASWAGTSFDARANGLVTIAVTVAPATAYAVQWSADNANWTALTCIDLSFNTASTIPTTFTGALSCQAGGYIRLNGGTGGTFLIGAGQ